MEQVPHAAWARDEVEAWVGLLGVGFWMECEGFVVESEDSTEVNEALWEGAAGTWNWTERTWLCCYALGIS